MMVILKRWPLDEGEVKTLIVVVVKIYGLFRDYRGWPLFASGHLEWPHIVVPLICSGHSQQRPPSLMWPQSFGAATMNAFTFPSR